MKALRPKIIAISSISLSIGFIVSVGRSQQPAAPKPNAPSVAVQAAPSKRQSPVGSTPSKEKKAPEVKTRTGAEDGAALKSENKPNQTELRQRGIELALQVGEEANGIDERRIAAIIQAVAADILWPMRKGLAHDLFEKAFETAVKYYKDTLDDNRAPLGKNSFTKRADVRVEIIKLINKRDAKMGAEYNEKFVEAKTREEQERAARAAAGQNRGRKENNFFGANAVATDGLIETANTLLSDDSKFAIEIARRASDLSVSPAFVIFITNLSRSDRAAADTLFLKALQGLSAAQNSFPGQLLALSPYPFGESEILIRDGSNNSSWGYGKAENFVVNPQHVQKFLTVALSSLQRMADPSTIQAPDAASRLGLALYAAKSLESKVATFLPALQVQWQEMTSALETLNTSGAAQKILQALARDREQKETRKGNESRRQFASRQKSKAEELLERAQQTNDFVQRDGFYGQAALAAEGVGDISKAMEIAGRISDITYREKIKSWLNFNASEKAIGLKRYDEARQFALGVDETDYRAYLFFQIAGKMIHDKDRDRGIELLEEAARRSLEAEDTQAKVKALCGVADLFLQIDQERSFGIADAMVRTANKVPADKLNLVEGGARMIRTLSHAGSTGSVSTDVVGFDLRKVFGKLAGYNFDRTLALAQAIENKSVKCWTLIGVAESAFANR